MIWRVFKAAAILALAGILALWIDHRSETVLPAPSGSFPVGRSILDWRNDAKPSQELLVWIWYPAAAPSSVPDDYLPAYSRSAFDQADNPVFRLVTRDRAKVRDHTFRDAPISPRDTSYPVVIFRGGASAEVSAYSVLAEDLASHGYVVAGLDAPYRTGMTAFPDGRVIQQLPANNVEFCQDGGETESPCIDNILHAWTSDIAFAVDRLTQLNASGRFAARLDLSHLGVFGHSFGGAQAAEFCHDDTRCKAAIDIDGLVFGRVAREGARQPLMFVFSDQINSRGDEPQRARARFNQVYEHLPAATRSRFFIRGSNHFLFSEEQALLTSHIFMSALRAMGVVRIDGTRQVAATAWLVHTFFDTWLKRTPDSPPAVSHAAYAEIEPLADSH